jgi:hypothetical protein
MRQGQHGITVLAEGVESLHYSVYCRIIFKKGFFDSAKKPPSNHLK